MRRYRVLALSAFGFLVLAGLSGLALAGSSPPPPPAPFRPLPAETLFSVSHRAGLTTAVSGFNWFERMIPAAERDAGFFTAGEDHAADVTVLEAALPWLAARDARLILLHLDQADYAGP